MDNGIDWFFNFLYVKRILKTKEALDNIRNFIDKQQLTNSDTPKKSTVPNEDKKGIR
ncbi:hypothetical protein CGG20_004763 [Salmonella enterica subsp. enterica serovar Anatum]|nr:hypothetical protein [Salmonella enterica subsp. enterica serovar Anatum]UUF22192.1 hypothetical protein JSMCR1_p516 [Escherichia coli]